MKNLTKIFLLLALLVVGQSCSDLLDNAQPSTAISQEVALNNEGAVEAIRANMYNGLHSFGYTTQYMLGPGALADQTYNRTGTNRFSGLANNAVGSGMSAYDDTYEIINNANILISGIPEGVLTDAVANQYKGEALFIRAFTMHHLVRALGYEPGVTPATGGGAGWNEGIIIRTEPTLSLTDAEFKARSTVAEVYAQIEADLLEAINLLSQNGTGNRIYATQAAAEALLARVYLYWQKFTEADQYATAALQHTSATLAQPGDVATMFDETAGANPEAIFLVNFNAPLEGIGQPVNDGLNAYTAQQWVAQVPTQDAIDLYSAADARLAWFGPCINDVEGSAVSGCLATHPAIPGGALEIKKWNGELGSFTDNVPHLRVAEMMLIQAEARLRGGLGNALAPLNELRAARGLTTPLAAITMQDILDERRREFIAEGHRFFDLKRLGMDIQKAPATGLADIPFSDFKVLDNLPEGEVALSEAEAPEGSTLLQNPGY